MGQSDVGLREAVFQSLLLHPTEPSPFSHWPLHLKDNRIAVQLQPQANSPLAIGNGAPALGAWVLADGTLKRLTAAKRRGFEEDGGMDNDAS